MMKFGIVLCAATFVMSSVAIASQCPDTGVFKKVIQENKQAIAAGDPFSFVDNNGATWRSINYYQKPDQGKYSSLDNALELTGFNWETAGENACRGHAEEFTILIHKK
jgi:hypothetical protein